MPDIQGGSSEKDEPQELLTGVLLKRAQLALRYRLDEALQELGLTMPQFVTLSSVHRQPGATNAELARLSFLTAQTMNSMLALLQTSGLIHRSGHATHRRLIRIELTEKGHEVLTRAERVVDGIERELVSLFSPTELSTLRDCLTRCAFAFGRNGSSG